MEKALSDVWLTTSDSFQIAWHNLLVKQKKNLILHQVSPRALFLVPLQLSVGLGGWGGGGG